MKILIKNGRVVDPANNIEEELDVLIDDGRIVKLEKGLKGMGIKVIDAKGRIVVPGLIDVHVHFREPGHEYKEDLHSGLRAAVRGGFTGVCPMPNTRPVIETQADVEFLLQKSKVIGLAQVFPVAAVTHGQEGKELTEFGELKKGGVVALSDDGHPIVNSQVMRRALEYAKKFDFVIMAHCEDLGLSYGGTMNEGFASTRMGLLGIPVESESVEVARDIQLADLTGSRLHFCHISARKSVDLIREARSQGSQITAETCPHYFMLTEDAVASFNTYAKMNPPLRTGEDREAIRKALKDGTINVISTDHAPHADYEKNREFDKAPFGTVGLETSLPLCLRLVSEGVLSLSQLIEKMSLNPARILKIDRGTLSPGAVADVTVFDPEAEWIFSQDESQSKSCNSPFLGWKLKGRATDVVVEGRVVMEDGKLGN